jgi:hypothetical protein
MIDEVERFLFDHPAPEGPAASMSGPRKHRLVAQLYQRGFARQRKKE